MLVVTIYFLISISIFFIVVSIFLWGYRALKNKRQDSSDKETLARGILYLVDKRPYLRRIGEGYIYKDDKKHRLFVAMDDGETFIVYQILSKGKNSIVFITKSLKRYVFFFYENYGV